MNSRILLQVAAYAVVGLGMSGVLVGCSGQQQGQEENLETTQQQGEEMGQNNAPNDNIEQGSVPSEADAAATGADINSATTDDAAQLDATLNGGGAANTASADAPTSGATLPNSASPGGADTAAAAPTAPAAGGPQAPVAGGRVRYVREGGVQVVNAPGGAPVFTLEQGDHPVTWEENGWLRLNTGMYVPADALSDQGVGRPNNGRSWTAQ
jgi:cytoskeletal protein RodZ